MRKKKYIEVKNMAELGIGILSILEEDVMSKRELVHDWYTVTTNGGDRILWEVNEKNETFYTVSTKELKRVRVNNYMTVPQYKHYHLTEKGLQYCKEQIMMASF